MYEIAGCHGISSYAVEAGNFRSNFTVVGNRYEYTL